MVAKLQLPGGEPQAWLMGSDRSVPLRLKHITYRRKDAECAQGVIGQLFLIGLPDGEGVRTVEVTLAVQAGSASVALGRPDLCNLLTDLRTLVREHLSGLEPEIRAGIMEFFCSALAAPARRANSLHLCRNLFLIREALRERLPLSIIEPGEEGVHVESIMGINETSFYIRGWLREGDAAISNLTVVSPEGSRAELSQRAFRYQRPDLQSFSGATADAEPARAMGFISFFELPVPSALRTGWVIETGNAFGDGVESVAPRLLRDPRSVRSAILADLAHERPGKRDLTRHHVFPALSRLQDCWQASVRVDSEDQHGAPPPAPEVSIIIPLYGRIDFLEQQLAQFVHDPEIRKADLIYVLDSPELADSLRERAAQLHLLYRVPFRTVILEQHVGFSAVNNVGASLARGRLLLLLNSDVLPDKPGWLGTMARFFDVTPRIGALGPKLLYEDDSLQHAGMYFLRVPGHREWENMHFFKGLSRHFAAAQVSRAVPAVTAACMMIDRELFTSLGGFRGCYVQGDYEDSDLCLRLIQAGYENWYLSGVELYHLEGQSYPAPLRRLASSYNRWQHSHLWHDVIEGVMVRFSSEFTGHLEREKQCPLST